MKTFKYILFIAALFLWACQEEFEIIQHDIRVTLQYPEGFNANDSTKVYVGNYWAYANELGQAQLRVPSGSYTLYVSDQQNLEDTNYYFNGTSQVDITSHSHFYIQLTKSTASPIIIKELYIGGSPKDDGSGAFTKDAYLILYNNSSNTHKIDSTYCIATPFPLNSSSPNYYLEADKTLLYEKEKWTPAALGIWHFTSAFTLEAGEQITIAIYQAINHLPTYSNSVDLSHPDNYCLYDIDTYSYEKYYATPSYKIPTSHYLNAIKYGSSSAWPLSISSPGLFLFKSQGLSPNAFISNADNNDYFGGKTNQLAKKVPNGWIIDAIEVFRQGYDKKNSKRFTDQIDAGSILFSTSYGYSLYRNVDKEATEAIANNKDLLIYHYQDGTENRVDGSTDPSGIDAEASIANGARIIYKDTNNSSNDFHQRREASIK